MKSNAVILSLFVIAQAYDFSKLKPAPNTPPPVYPARSAPHWMHVYANLHRHVPLRFKNGTVRAPENAGVAVHHDTRVVDCKPASRGQFPWQVLLRMDDSYVCGGSMISSNWILSAGHCASNFSNFVVILGTQRSDDLEPDVVKTTRDKIVHERFDPKRVDNDISLIHLAEAVVFTQYIQAARLPTRSMQGDALVGKTVTVSGWGKPLDSSPGIKDVLHYVKMPVMDNKRCSEVYGDVITDSKICTDTAGGRSSCHGDSGGPLVLKMSDGRYTEVGIVSFGSSAGCKRGYPAVFTRVTSFLDWIESNTGMIIDKN